MCEFGVEECGYWAGGVAVGVVDEVFGVVDLRGDVETAVGEADAFQAEGCL